MTLFKNRVILYSADMKSILATGILNFLGENTLLKTWGLQATINRTPYQIKSLDQVQAYDEEKLRIEHSFKLT